MNSESKLQQNGIAVRPVSFPRGLLMCKIYGQMWRMSSQNQFYLPELRAVGLRLVRLDCTGNFKWAVCLHQLYAQSCTHKNGVGCCSCLVELGEIILSHLMWRARTSLIRPSVCKYSHVDAAASNLFWWNVWSSSQSLRKQRLSDLMNSIFPVRTSTP